MGPAWDVAFVKRPPKLLSVSVLFAIYNSRTDLQDMTMGDLASWGHLSGRTWWPLW